jgi:phenylalanyl-tRNA synthetase alpha chain
MELNKIKTELEKLMSKVNKIDDLNSIRNNFSSQYLDSLQSQIKTSSSTEEKKSLGQNMNQVKKLIIECYDQNVSRIKSNTDEAIDERSFITNLPDSSKKLHVLNQVAKRICKFLEVQGFKFVEGDDITTELYNFERLNMPKDHPARTKHDTFFITEENILRTHATATSSHTLEKMNKFDDIRVMTYGNVYRKDDDDATHSHQFTQLDVFWVSRNVSVANLKWMILNLCKFVFENDNLNIRMRPSFFPFTEPSYEVDISCFICNGNGCSICKKSGWIEILGCGMLHPNVLKKAGIKDDLNGFAWGIGIERCAMIKYQIDDIRLFYQNDIRFLEQFWKDK